MQAKTRVLAVPPAAPADEPTLAEIKRALHDMPRSGAGAPGRDYAEVLREVHELVRRLARVNGVDPDDAVQRRRDAIQAQRESMSRCR
jgi:hypothetical protein